MISEVKIGGIRHKIVTVSDLHSVDDKGLKVSFYGQIEYKTGLIKLESDACLDQQKSTLIHEIMHGVLSQAGQEDHDEKQLVILGYGLYQVLRDNPELVALIIE